MKWAYSCSSAFSRVASSNLLTTLAIVPSRELCCLEIVRASFTCTVASAGVTVDIDAHKWGIVMPNDSAITSCATSLPARLSTPWSCAVILASSGFVSCRGKSHTLCWCTVGPPNIQALHTGPLTIKSSWATGLVSTGVLKTVDKLSLFESSCSSSPQDLPNARTSTKIWEFNVRKI